MELAVDVSSVKKNPSGKFIDTQQKMNIIKLYKSKILMQANLPLTEKLKYVDLIKAMSQEIGIGQRTISTTLSEYRKKGTVSSPNKTKVRPTIIQKVNDFDKNIIRQKIHGFWYRKEIPTMKKILNSINEDPSLPNFKRTSFQKILQDLNFVYCKKNHNSALTERGDLICWRSRYIEEIRHHRSRGRPIYYLDETCINAEETTSITRSDNTVISHKGLPSGKNNQTGKGQQLIVFHIGSSDGFVDGGLLVFESKKNSGDCNDEINSDTFNNWFCSVLPWLKENAVVVMDNAPYHCIQKHTFPLISWKKENIIDWLEARGKIIDRPMVKHRLLEMAEEFRPRGHNYVIDELAKEQNKIVLRLPPYHSVLNPIELAWLSVKHHINNSTCKINDVKTLLIEGVERVTARMWKNFISHVTQEEDKLYEIDFITEKILDEESNTPHVMAITEDTSDTDDEIN